MDQSKIRNFSIVAHIDHGKTTLSDRLLEYTGTVSQRDMVPQLLDSMELEREKGITIKARAVRMTYLNPSDGQTYILNLIDTPGHVDFTYEVSRSLAACDGILLLVDASQGIQAQTLAHFYTALEQDLPIIPVVTKIDLPNANPQHTAEEIGRVLGIPKEAVLYTSAKEGLGIKEVLGSIVNRVPSPRGHLGMPLRALVFDSHYDLYKGVVAYVRVEDGLLRPGMPMLLMNEGVESEVLEVGVFAPLATPVAELSAGEVGYVATGLKTARELPVGDTITEATRPAQQPLPGYAQAKPMVFAGLYPADGASYQELRDALEKLRLNDASLFYEPETSVALGFGFRCGFLGLLHMEIVRERLEREFGLNLLITAPSVAYKVTTNQGDESIVDNPVELPPPHEIAEIAEPWMAITIVTPTHYIGNIMELGTGKRGEFQKMEYLDEERVILTYQLPLVEMLVEFYDQLKSITQGYASMDYTFADYRPGPLVRVDILVNNQLVDALSVITHRDKAHAIGRGLIERLRQVIPRQLFEVPIQAAIGSRVIARETIKALRKNVLAKCYGGDVTRKRKLLEKQAEGKKRMKKIGRVEIPQEAFTAVLKLE